MQFSVVATFAGIPNVYSHDTSYGDVLRACENAGFDVSESEPGDTDYRYLASEHYPSTDFEWTDLPEDAQERADAIDALAEKHGVDSDDFWWRWGWDAQEIQVAGILDKKAFSRWLDDLGAFAEDCQTLGTLGGPLSDGMPYVVPDIPFRMESQILIESIRATPIPTDHKGEPLRGDQHTWDRLRKATLAVYGC